MNVSCPNCATVYRVDPAKIPEGATVLVAGGGGIGIAIMQGARIAGATNIILSDPVAERREAEVPVHYLGFTIPNKFVFGYGLDIDEYHRNLPFIGVVDLDKYKPIT